MFSCRYESDDVEVVNSKHALRKVLPSNNKLAEEREYKKRPETFLMRKFPNDRALLVVSRHRLNKMIHNVNRYHYESNMHGLYSRMMSRVPINRPTRANNHSLDADTWIHVYYDHKFDLFRLAIPIPIDGMI